MAPKHQRLAFAIFGVTLLVASALLVLNRFSEHLVFFYTPTQLLNDYHPMADAAPPHMRLGGLVETGSLKQNDMHYRFNVTDLSHTVAVEYEGLPPALFREGQGVVVEGTFVNGVFTADRLLAKHDENYMPPEIAKALKENGYWKDGDKPHDAITGPVTNPNPLSDPAP